MLALVRVQSRVARAQLRPSRIHRCSGPLNARSEFVALSPCRFFAGRASRGGSDNDSADSNNSKKSEIETKETEKAPSDSSKLEVSVGDASASASATSSDATGSSESGSSATASKASANRAQALFALPLYRKPAFPGFYQIVQVSEQEVLDFLFSLRKSGQGEYLGGFLTKELPSNLENPEAAYAGASSKSSSGSSSPSQAQGLRRDAGRVANVDALEEVGTVLQVINLTQYPNISGGQVVVMPRHRIRRTRVVSAPSPNVALAAVGVEYLKEPEVPQDDENLKAVQLEVITTMKEVIKNAFLYKEQFEQVIRFYDLDHALKLADLVAGLSLSSREELQAILVEDDITERLKKVQAVVKKDLELAKLQSEVKSQVEEKVTNEQRRIMLMEQMRQIQKELGIEGDEKATLIEGFRDAIKDKVVPEEASKVIEHELQRLGTIEPSSSEYNVCRTYLEWLTCLPWGKFSEENKSIQTAEGILNEDHYGLEDVKERILEHIAVSFLKESVQGKIMCLVGPPGVGKTSIGKSIARALGREYYRFSVGGMHDVAEIRGHRRTYVGAMPGKLIQCLKTTQSSNPVVLIDEIDKLGRDARGDPSSALLEILDPEQNNSFRDHYLDVPIDLSRVLFVCTANVLDTIPGPLLDRMEVIRIAGYVFEEKEAIAKQYLLPQTREACGIDTDRLDLQEGALHKLISDYAREAGVRKLEQLLEKVTRKVALKVVRTKKDEEVQTTSITADNLSDYIGQPTFQSERLFAPGLTPPGVVMGLAWTSQGGSTLFIEARGRLPRSHAQASGVENAGKEPAEKPRSHGQGSLKITGQLGEVMTESCSISMTYAQLFARELDKKNDFLDEANVHLNVPEGAIPKDGPSAGVTMTTALLSIALDRPVLPDLAMTGELTLSGKVLKVGGIKEKVIAARREGVTTLLLPRQNEADYLELKEYLRAGLTCHFIDHYDDIYRLAFDQTQLIPLPAFSRGLPVVSVTTPLQTETDQTATNIISNNSQVPHGPSQSPQPAGSIA